MVHPDPVVFHNRHSIVLPPVSTLVGCQEAYHYMRGIYSFSPAGRISIDYSKVDYTQIQ